MLWWQQGLLHFLFWQIEADVKHSLHKLREKHSGTFHMLTSRMFFRRTTRLYYVMHYTLLTVPSGPHNCPGAKRLHLCKTGALYITGALNIEQIWRRARRGRYFTVVRNLSKQHCRRVLPWPIPPVSLLLLQATNSTHSLGFFTMDRHGRTQHLFPLERDASRKAAACYRWWSDLQGLHSKDFFFFSRSCTWVRLADQTF